LHHSVRASHRFVINNAGGGIFEHLPVAQFNPPFEEFFATPQKVDFAKLCAAYGIEHVAVGDWEQLGTHLEHLPANGVHLLEVVTDRKMDAATRNAKDMIGRLTLVYNRARQAAITK
jgi:2-succinyl-5-enolpyruvyl-6-hydroxy-3-cyclohexene-1-carboxylate synthase